MDDFLRQLGAHLRAERLLPRRAHIVVGVSGGIDSVVLLHALEALQSEFDWKLSVAHFNHQLRGSHAVADERFVRRMADRLILPCTVGHWSVEAREAAIRGHGIEMAAREARRQFFGEVLQQERARHLALAHHADDQAELFFIRLLRGASAGGLGGMRARRRHGSPVNAWIVRPLLHLQRAQLEEWAKTRRLRHCHDGSNDDLRLLRNRVRHELMPLLKSRFCPGTDSNIRRTMRGLADDADFLRTAAQTWLAASGKMPFGRLHPALQRQIIVRQLERLKAEFDWQAVEQLRTTEEDWANLPGGKQIARSADGRLRVRPQPPERTVKSIKPVELNLQAPSGRVQFAGVEFRWQIAAAGRTPRFGAGREYFDADRVGETITLRSWRPGDRFQPIGLSRSAKLQDLFTNARIQRERRQSLVVGENSVGEIFWVEGLRLAEGFKLTAATRRVLHWQWRRIGRKPAARTGAK